MYAKENIFLGFHHSNLHSLKKKFIFFFLGFNHVRFFKNVLTIVYDRVRWLVGWLVGCLVGWLVYLLFIVLVGWSPLKKTPPQKKNAEYEIVLHSSHIS